MCKLIFKGKSFFAKKIAGAMVLSMALLGSSLVRGAEDSATGKGDIEIIDPLRVVFNAQTNTGYIQHVFCNGCKPEKLYLTSETKVYANSKKVPLNKITDRLGRYVSLTYEIDSKNVIKVSW